MKEAGAFAKEKQQTITPQAFKEASVGSVVTETDLAVSQMFEKFVSSHFQDLNYVIIDEGTLYNLGEDKYKTVSKHGISVRDRSIDGTHPYNIKMPDYAISVGIMKNYEKPYLGAICLPALGEVVYFDGKNVHWMQNIYDSDVRDSIIEPQELSNLAIFGNDWFVRINNNYDKKKETIVNLYSCIVRFFYMATNRGRGYYFGSFIWDMAGC